MDNWKIVNSTFSAKEMAKAKFNSNLGMSDIHVIPKLDLTAEIQGTQWANTITTIHTMKQNISLILQQRTSIALFQLGKSLYLVNSLEWKQY